VTLLVGTDCVAVRDLATALQAELLALPAVPGPAGIDWAWADELEAWRTSAADGPRSRSVVVAAWPDDPGEPLPLDELELDGWMRRHEVPFARWFAALGVAAARCADRGAIVAVAEQPAPLDCAGRAAETGLADAIETLARSLARSEGPRGVRVNTVTTPARLTRPPVVLPPPPLATFPGAVTLEVAGAVRALLSHDSAGITATTVHADCGRTGR
jgi:NAD(P)-dependent dehydrogenase (short-subunit alcohol dehydrogenase family)